MFSDEEIVQVKKVLLAIKEAKEWKEVRKMLAIDIFIRGKTFFEFVVEDYSYSSDYTKWLKTIDGEVKKLVNDAADNARKLRKEKR
jgi:hypothetical protein